MRQGQLRRIFILLVAVLLCLVMARVSFSGQRESAGDFTLWYLETECPPAAMERLAALCREETGVQLAVRGFSDEQALGAAFETGLPDLLLCGHVRAGGIYAHGGLREPDAAPSLPDGLREAGDAVGAGFYPIGARLMLLLVNTALAEPDFPSLEALLAAGGDAPFLVTDDVSELLYTAAFSRGWLLQGSLGADGANRVPRALYNALAEAAFRGAFIPTEHAAAYVRQGLAACAALRSDALAGLTGGQLAVRPLPPPEGGQARYPAELVGFAVLEGADTGKAAVFLRWLFDSPRGGETALAAGLVPLQAGLEGQNYIERSLAELSGKLFLYYSPCDAPFCLRRADYERELRAALDLLV